MVTPGSGSVHILEHGGTDGCSPLEAERGRNWLRDFFADGEMSWQSLCSNRASPYITEEGTETGEASAFLT